MKIAGENIFSPGYRPSGRPSVPQLNAHGFRVPMKHSEYVGTWGYDMNPKKYKKNSVGLSRLIRALGCSLAGFASAIKYEAAFRQELLLCLLLLPAGCWLGRTGMERALLTGSLLLVLMVELLNSAMEAVVDRIGTEIHPLSGRAKDLGSAAVFVSLINVVAVWLFVLL